MVREAEAFRALKPPVERRGTRCGCWCAVLVHWGLWGLPVLEAGEFWSWHGFDFVPVRNARFEWTVHTRVRSRAGEFQQGRSGTLLKWQALPRIAPIVGYYYGKEEDSAEEFRDFHRLFGGAEVNILRQGGWTLMTRGLVERFFREDRSGLTRYRHRFRLVTARKIGPYLQSELFFDRDGYLSGRHSGGVRWQTASWVVVEAGYLYDHRRFSIGEPRHVLVTSMTFAPPKRKRD